jgi:menaquinone-dependent protoporphyrinogen oxidase
MKNVLVTYATRSGSTTEIAEKIAEVLRSKGENVTIQPVAGVTDLNSYNAVVLGSAVYMGHWMKDAVEFLEKHEGGLATRPVWIFSSGPTGPGDPVKRMHGWRFPEAQQAIADRIKPLETILFHGNIDIGNLNFGEKIMIRALGAPTGDFRDWNAITAWAESIAQVLRPLEVVTTDRKSSARP